MIKPLLKINPEKEEKKIVAFLKKTFQRQGLKKAVIGLSGGIDSMVSFYLLKKCLPVENIIVMHMYYTPPDFASAKKVLKESMLPSQNIHQLSIKKPVDELAKLLEKGKAIGKIRTGNIKARIRMIMLFDLAKKHHALVAGTENKSEHLLGYFTRFGDQAADIEPIEHLYKTQVFQLAKHLGVPSEIINKAPSAGLWKGQTDEKEFGFTYNDADQVLYLLIDKKMSIKEIEKMGFKNAKNILAWRKKNLFKHQAPYTL